MKAAVRFRNRKINNKQSLPVYRAQDIPDLDESLSLQRSIPQAETGVDKEEESEHHLQAAISASQLSTTTGEAKALYIPTPDASRKIENYNDLYTRLFTAPSTLIRFSSTVEDCVGCPYTMDEEDEKWLATFNASRGPKEDAKLSEDHFEQVMWQFEKTTNERVPFLHLDKGQIPPFDEIKNAFMTPQLGAIKHFAQHVYPWWSERRNRRGGKMIMPQLKYEEVVRNEADPYLCFRRRESKPVRKTRRTDQQSIEKLRRLRMEMESARSLLEMVSRREKVRKESLVLEHMIFDQRCKVREYRRNLGIKEEDDDSSHKKKNRKAETSATIRIPLNFKDRDPLSQDKDRSGLSSIDAELAKRREDDVGWEDLTDNPYQPFLVPFSQQCYKSLSQPRNGRFASFRKRMGRGGRLHIDRHFYRPSPYPKEAFARDPFGSVLGGGVGGGGGPAHGYNGYLGGGGGVGAGAGAGAGGFGHPLGSPHGQQDYVFDKFRFDNDGFDQDEIVDDLRDGMIRYRCTLLSETDLRSLSTSTRHHFISMAQHSHSSQ